MIPIKTGKIMTKQGTNGKKRKRKKKITVVFFTNTENFLFSICKSNFIFIMNALSNNTEQDFLLTQGSYESVDPNLRRF